MYVFPQATPYTFSVLVVHDKVTFSRVGVVGPEASVSIGAILKKALEKEPTDDGLSPETYIPDLQVGWEL